MTASRLFAAHSTMCETPRCGPSRRAVVETHDYGHDYAGHNIRATMPTNTRTADTHHGARYVCAANYAAADMSMSRPTTKSRIATE